ncbi:MAG: hypothetical protein PHH47_12375 [Gallionella sp.]|nr:hypothetical protein [Gallionella sp.]MDD4947612.1 hypothetical protein [Gallionella sp.]MDD5611515.1 hypothetical protein [Gallionella sp.]
MEIQSSDAERKRARHLHAVLLFDLVVTHIFLFLMALTLMGSFGTFPIIMVVILSVILLTYILVMAKRSLTTEPSWYVRCHWQFAAKRARLFLFLFLALGTLTLALYYGGTYFQWKKVATWALTGGFGLLPFMVSVLGLIVIEFDAEHQSRVGKVPAGALVNYPPPAEEA